MYFALSIFNKMGKKLTIEYEDETIYAVIGISSALKDYRLIFFLNKLGDFDFKRTENFIFRVKDCEFKYPLYTYIDDFNLQNFFLLSNKTNSVKLVPDFKHFDYILLLEGEFEDAYINELTKKIKSVSGVMLASKLNFNSINKVPNLSLSFEMHLDKILKTN